MQKSVLSLPGTGNDLPIMEPGSGRIVLFHPHMPASAPANALRVLRSRWIGQGPNVEAFEERFSTCFTRGRPSVAVGSGTDALHLAYVLAGIAPGDEVIAPVFTCTATNIPLLYIGAKVVFADVQTTTLNIDPDDVRRRITEKTRAIVCVHYGGLPCDMDELHGIADEHNLVMIEDAAHAIGAEYRGRRIGELSSFTAFSFQAIKHITTGDGGMLVVDNEAVAAKAKRLRWFGIDRKAKQQGIWDNDIVEVGYKYQMTDVAAALGLAALDEFDQTLAHRQRLLAAYEDGLRGVPGLAFVGGSQRDRVHGAWLCTVLAERSAELRSKLHDGGIESGQVHYRNDRYSIFGGRRPDLPNMDAVEDRYLVLPLHTQMRVDDVHRITSAIRSGW